ncbi:MULTISPECIES: enoyl-CoA hydratase/isomerase family protein [unclassified Caballeronia]|uniref:enoyl-CoA hydratase/isomerase family protein n=1 Tax=unclassified Caballeronia TaxID=2646786 RepID=UPI00285F13B3|nr:MULTISPECIES: enoyl-CoA hydratase/isomerase family protein [unclassified Caballeronia]MDR5752440.1 enoyl-CoA hydratase/isomerase family protein [Caballeronia sp. LZ024]MDR5845246.1 enoyl-CoA hydratase/isomerase family protein [Caballeronia sp. LZ031]
MTSTDSLLIEDRAAVRLLTMNRPDKRNALNNELTQALLDALEAADRDPSVKAIVLAGAGQAFCAGADIKEFGGFVNAGDSSSAAQAALDRAHLTTNLHRVFSQLGKPVIGAAQGYAMGGGAGLALACDMLVAGESLKLGYPELKHGIVAAIVMANLVRQVGRKTAFELVSLGESVDAARALSLGLANRVVADAELVDAAVGIAERLAACDASAMAATKRLFHRVADLPLQQALDASLDTNMMMRSFRQDRTNQK